MEPRRLTTVVGPGGRIRIDVPSSLPPGPVDVTVVVTAGERPAGLRWRDLYGLGQGIWAGEDAQVYVDFEQRSAPRRVSIAP
jgi:hypothetical protein